MPLPRFTVDQVMAFAEICYTREQVEALFAGRATITVADILAMEIPQDDKIWVIVQLLSDRGRADVVTAKLAHIDPDSGEYADCQAENAHTWTSLYRHLSAKGMSREQVRQIVFDAVVAAVQAEAAR